MPLSRDPDRIEQGSSGPNNRLYRLRELIGQDGLWGGETDVVVLRWNGTKWELWRGEEPTEEESKLGRSWRYVWRNLTRSATR